MTGARCCIAACGNYSVKTRKDEKTKHIRYHRFPKQPERSDIWMERCNREKKCNPRSSFICSKHFTEDDYERDLQSELLGLDKQRKLKSTALPTRFLTTREYIDDFLEEKVSQKVNPAYKIPEKKQIKIENVFSMNVHSLPAALLTNVYQDQSPLLLAKKKQLKELPLPNQQPSSLPIVLLPYKSTLQKGTQTTAMPVFNNVKPPNAKSKLQNNTNIDPLNPDLRRDYKYDSINLKVKKLQEKNDLLQKRYNTVRHAHLKSSARVQDLKREKAMNVLTIKRLTKEINTIKNEKDKKNERLSGYEAALKSVFSENQIKLLMGKKKVHWTAEDLSKAFTLFYYSKKTYLFLKHVIGMPLPGLSTLKYTATKYNGKGKEAGMHPNSNELESDDDTEMNCDEFGGEETESNSEEVENE